MNERDGRFHAGKTSPNHAVEIGTVTMAKIVMKIKAEVLKDKFKSASATVTESILAENVNGDRKSDSWNSRLLVNISTVCALTTCI